MYKILSVNSNLDTPQVIKNVVHSMPERFRLCGQFTSSIDALEIAAALKPDIIIYSDLMQFIGASQFIRSLTRKGVRTLYVLLSNLAETSHLEHTVNLVKATIPERDLCAEKLRELLEKLYSDLCIGESQPYYVQTSFHAEHHTFPWMKENELFARLINNPLDSVDIHSPIISCRQGYLPIGSPICLPGEYFSFFNDLKRFNEFYANTKLLMEAYGKGNIFIIQENKLCIWIEPFVMVSKVNSFFTEFCGSINSTFEYDHISQLTFQRSDTVTAFEDLPGIYRAVNQLGSYRFFIDDRIIICSDYLTTNSENITLDTIQDIRNGLETSFENRNIEEYQNCIDDLFLYAKKSLSFNTYSYIWNQLIFWYNL